MITGSMAVLDIGAKRRQEWLYDIYQMGRDAIEQGEEETYVIARDQWDSGVAAKLVNVLRHGGVEIERATAPFTAGGRSYGAGSFLVRGAQAFRPYLNDLLNPQVYPDRRLYPGGPPELPYDVTGWTLPLQMGVDVQKVGERVEAPAEPVEWAVPEPGTISGKGDWGWAFDPRSNDSFTAVNRLQAAGARVWRLNEAFDAGDSDFPAGAFVVRRSAGLASTVERAVEELGITAIALAEAPSTGSREQAAPRIGLYHAWGGNMDEGWTRWVLEQFEFPYERVFDRDLRAGDLGARFDVLLLPDSSWRSMLSGLDPELMPKPYAGGMGAEGAYNIYRFVESGGTLVTMDTAAELPLTLFGLPIVNVVEGRDNDRFFIPGSILGMELDNGHPIAWGMPEQSSGFFARSPAFRVGRRASMMERHRDIEPAPPKGISVVASWAEQDDLLHSGWMLGGGAISEQAAVVEAEMGEGRVILLGLRTQHRGQTHATFKLLFNALMRGGLEG